jgi:hypothetical protein
MIHAWDKYDLEAASQEHEARYYRRRGKQGKVPTLDYWSLANFVKRPN